MSITVGQPARRGRHRPNEAGPLLLMTLGTAVAFGLLLYDAVFAKSFDGRLELRSLAARAYRLTNYANGRDLGVIQGPRAEASGALREVAAARSPARGCGRFRATELDASRPHRRLRPGPRSAADIVRDATDSHVFGIEVDNDITGRYESFLDPEAKLADIRALAAEAHKAGNRAFVYIAGTECITANADTTPHTLAKDHPDWLQRKRTGEPAVFTGGAAFWIRKGDEDVWISPYATAWREQYMTRVRQIAATGIDGIYVDIPYWMTHFDGWEDSWASFDDYTVEAFRRKTGLDAKPRSGHRQLRGSAFPPVDRFPHRDHHRVHGRDRSERQGRQPGDHDDPRDLSGHRASGRGGRRRRLPAVRRHGCHRARVRVRRRQPHGDLAHATRLVPLSGGHAHLPRVRPGQGDAGSSTTPGTATRTSRRRSR